ncbi:MAG: hypothetical protein ACLQBK_25830 [Candidatus Sulfotelmatobacter sp.]
MAISPTAEGFRAAFRRPALTLGEITWRWVTGATAAALLFFGLFELLDTLPVTSGDLLFLRTRHPYLVAQAIAHIFRGSLGRAMMAGLLAVLMLGLLWIVAASLGRIATVRSLLDYFFRNLPRSSGGASAEGAAAEAASKVSTNLNSFDALTRLNFLRAAVALAAMFGFVGAAILAGFASPDADPSPGLAFLLFLPLAGLICLAWWSLNWLLSLAGLFAVRDGEDALGSISAAVSFCRERTGAVFAVSTWTGLAHLVAFVGATTVISMPLGFAGVLPWRLVLLGVLLVTLAYFVLADWLYMARLAGYVCIAEMPEALLAPLPPSQTLTPPPGGLQATPSPPIQTTIDRDETILSDVPNSPVQTHEG